MRIAQVAPLYESVPPQLYGGSERVVSNLTEELVRRGHEVTLFASGDSRTTAKLVECARTSLRLDGSALDAVAFTLTEMADVFDAQDEFDIIHNHADYYAFPFARFSRTPVVTTTHGRLDLPEVQRVYRHFGDANLISISRSQRAQLPELKWIGTAHNGIDFASFKLHPEPGGYLAFLGRISIEKRVDRAIEVARMLDMPLKIAAKVDDVDRDYFEHAIRPLLNSRLVEFVGEIGEHEKDEFLGSAYAYLFPIDWPEPFGLTMVEAMACGTPVVAMKCGAVPEVVADGVSGFVCDTMADFIRSIPLVTNLDRAACREYAFEHFSAKKMADTYESLYAGLVTPSVSTPQLENLVVSHSAVTAGLASRRG